MAKNPSLARFSQLLFRHKPPFMASSPSLSFPLPLPNPRTSPTLSRSQTLRFSTTSTRFPLQYEMIVSRPDPSSLPARRRPRLSHHPQSPNSPESEETHQPFSPELGLEHWVDRKLSSGEGNSMDKSKRKYYNKRRKRMYGSDSDEEGDRDGERLVELKPEVVELRTLHKREEELYFYDMFTYPWEKEKHYKMVYQLEKKYFPEHCLDKAFLPPGESNSGVNLRSAGKAKARRGVQMEKGGDFGGSGEDKGLVFFEEDKDGEGAKADGLEKRVDVSERSVEEFFTCLKKVPNRGAEVSDGEPYIVTRSGELPPTWDSPNGTVVLLNKPKGE